MDIASLYKLFLKSGNVSTDTRQIIPGSLFFALKGPQFNANTFATEALRKGAAFAIVDEAEFAVNDNIILVEDVLRSLQQLALHHRNQLSIPVVGLTGSNGKTTTKELMFAVLSRKYRASATSGNLNNHIGVPLTLLAITAQTEIAIVEMGANHVGEIAFLSQLARPTHGLITNIGRAHIGTFGGYDNIVRAKSELFDYLEANGGEAFINTQSPSLKGMAGRFRNSISYPGDGDYYHAEMIDADPFIRFKAENGEVVSTHLIGGYNFENIAAALCVGKHFGVHPNVANKAVADYRPQSMRSQVIQRGTNTIILDAYNANPSSMEAAVVNLAQMKASRKVAILGDMYELEGESDAEHRNLGALLRNQGIREVYLCGKLIHIALKEIPGAAYYSNKEDLISKLKASPIQNATILVKGSRGMKMETVVESL